MHSGNVGLSQGIDGLLDVAERFRDLPDVVIAIVGDGAQKASCWHAAEAAALHNVRFFPVSAEVGVCIDSFATADVFIVSLKRGLSGFIVPSKLYGILAAGRPFIAAVEDDCEAAEIARAHDCGIVVAPGDARAGWPSRDSAAARGSLREPGDGRATRAQAGLLFDRRRAVDVVSNESSGVDEWTPSHGADSR